MNARERLALAGLVAVALVGHGIRWLSGRPEEAPGGMVLVAGVAPADPLRHRARSERAGRPLRPGERIPLNRAPVEELGRLPKVGPGLARTLVQRRDDRGGFASVAELDSVPGVGPALLAAVLPHLDLSDTDQVRRRRPAVSAPQPPPLAPQIVSSGSRSKGSRTAQSPGPPVRLNSASQADLERLPGIGPTRAKAILAYRQIHGPFASVSDLENVPGLSRRLVRQLASQVAVP